MTRSRCFPFSRRRWLGLRVQRCCGWRGHRPMWPRVPCCHTTRRWWWLAGGCCVGVPSPAGLGRTTASGALCVSVCGPRLGSGVPRLLCGPLLPSGFVIFAPWLWRLRWLCSSSLRRLCNPVRSSLVGWPPGGWMGGGPVAGGYI